MYEEEGASADEQGCRLVFNLDSIGAVTIYEASNQPTGAVQTRLVNGVSVVAEGELVAASSPAQPSHRSAKN